MEFFFTEEFISEFKKIIKGKEHKDLESLFIDEILEKTFDEILYTGTTKQSGDNTNSLYIKKRIGKKKSGKRGGYRSYISVLIKNQQLYFIFIHPKTGRRAMVKLETEKEIVLIKKLKEDKENNNLIEICLNDERSKIIDKNTEEEIF